MGSQIRREPDGARFGCPGIARGIAVNGQKDRFVMGLGLCTGKIIKPISDNIPPAQENHDDGREKGSNKNISGQWFHGLRYSCRMVWEISVLPSRKAG